jgi:hypothetical protein
MDFDFPGLCCLTRSKVGIHDTDGIHVLLPSLGRQAGKIMTVDKGNLQIHMRSEPLLGLVLHTTQTPMHNLTDIYFSALTEGQVSRKGHTEYGRSQYPRRKASALRLDSFFINVSSDTWLDCYWKTELRGLRPRANYTDRTTAACRRSKCQLL